MFEKNEAVKDALISLGMINPLEKDNAEVFKKYICQLHGQKNIWISMMLGCICFAKNKQKEDTGWLSFVKKYNGSLLQLCKGVLKEEMKNTQLVARKWISVVDVHTQMMIQKDLVGYLETTEKK